MRDVRRRLALTLAVAAVAAAGTASAQSRDPIFDQSRLHEVRLVMEPNDWAALRQNFRSNQFYATNVSLDGEVVQQVGVRSRGKGSRSGTKPGLLLDFNKYVTNQQFHGMKRLVLDNQIQDNTFLKEPLSYVVFEAMGIASPQISYARVTVNDEYWGVYWIIENIGKDFLRARFGEDAGNLYEYDYVDDWRFTVRGDGTQRSYVPGPFKPETNEENNDSSPLARFVDHANTASTTGFGATMGQYIDVNKWLTHVAVENALAGSDGVVGQQGMNNFYLYQAGGGGKFVLIPWDQDTTFVSATWPIEFGLDTNVLIRKLVADPALKQVYLEAVKRTAAVALNPAVLLPKIEAYYTLIREAVLSDTKKPFTNEEFEQGVQGMRGMVAARPENINAQ